MHKIWINDGIEGEFLLELRNKGYYVENQHLEGEALQKALVDYDVLIIRSATKINQSFLEGIQNGKLKAIIRAGVGLDNIDVTTASALGIRVFNTPNASSIAVAELTFAHLLNLSRKMIMAHRSLSEGRWEKKALKGQELYGKTIGLIGMGRIGKEVAMRCHAFGMDVLYHVPSGPKPEFGHYQYVSLEDLAKKSDFISLHAPYDPQRGPLITRAFLNQVKKGAYLVNASRGKLVDEAALVGALNSGVLAGAALDVFNEEPPQNQSIISHPKVLLSPHLGASTVEAQRRIGKEIIDIVETKIFDSVLGGK